MPDPVREATGGGDRWVQAHVEIDVPLKLPVDAPRSEKSEALRAVMDEIVHALGEPLAEYVGYGRWDDMTVDASGGAIPIRELHEIAATLADRLGLDNYRRDAAFGVIVDYETAAPSVSQQQTGEREALNEIADALEDHAGRLSMGAAHIDVVNAVAIQDDLLAKAVQLRQLASVPSQQEGGGHG